MSKETIQNELKVEDDSIKNNSFGAILSIIMALIGIGLVYFSFILVFDDIIASEMAAGRAGGEEIIDGVSVSQSVMPIVNDIILLGGALWAVSAFGFLKKETWAWSMALFANVLSLLSFFMLIPAMSRGISPIYFAVFIPNVIAFLLLLFYLRKINTHIIVMSLLAGMAYVMGFMNGVASTDQMLSGTPDANFFLVGQRLSWFGAFAWAGFVIALLNRKDYAIRLGLTAAIVTLIAGIPIGVVTTIEKGELSMFLMAPVISIFLKVIFFSPKGNNVIKEWINQE